MTIDSITTLTATVGWTLVRVASRVLLSLTQWLFVAFAWLALAFVGAAMLLRWSWKPVRRSAVAVTSAVLTVRP
jgi:putative Mn2+ efflux pump MntP